MARRYTRGSRSRAPRRAARSFARAPKRSYGRSRPVTQRLEIVHVMGPGGQPGGYMPGVPGTIGVANVPPEKKGRTF